MTLANRLLKSLQNGVIAASENSFDLVRIFFDRDDQVVSNEAAEILSNPKDKERYLNAIKGLMSSKEKETTVKLGNGSQIEIKVD